MWRDPVEKRALLLPQRRALRLQGTSEDELKKLEEVLAKAKDVEEAITEFRRLKDDSPDQRQQKSESATQTRHGTNGKYLVAKDEDELIGRLHDGYRLVQPLNDDKYLLENW